VWALGPWAHSLAGGAMPATMRVIESATIGQAACKNSAYAARQEKETDMRLSDENLRGRTVISADGQVIGSIKSVFLDATDWRVESISVELRKDVADRIGASRSMFHRGQIEVPVRLIQSVGDTVVLGAEVDALREVSETTTADTAPPG
jgi:sporulation protein YlmC with PRC-barrel domain